MSFRKKREINGILWKGKWCQIHSAYIRPGGVSSNLPKDLVDDISNFVFQFFFRIDEIKDLLSKNRIWIQRLVNIGIVSKKEALSYGFSGVMLRGSGVFWDLRLSEGYDCYDILDFMVPVGIYGDCYDRYLIRLEEMRESCQIIKQCVDILDVMYLMDDFSYITDDYKIVPPSRRVWNLVWRL